MPGTTRPSVNTTLVAMSGGPLGPMVMSAYRGATANIHVLPNCMVTVASGMNALRMTVQPFAKSVRW
jgi:hypothetical protein